MTGRSRALLSRARESGAIFVTSRCLLPGSLAGEATAHPGQWSTLNTRTFTQVHMVLVRGDASPYHSRILTWDEDLGGEELGWQPGSGDCGGGAWDGLSAPLGTWAPGARIFCDGHTHLAGDGGLLSAGGDDGDHVVTGQGLRDARTYQAGSQAQPGGWTARAKLQRERFYPTVTGLADGRAIAVGGVRSPQLWVVGGRRNGEPPAAGSGDELHRLGRASDGIWDPVITPAAPNGRPAVREGHTTVRLVPDQQAQVVFGGKDAAGNTVDKTVWLLTRSDSTATHPDYRYEWSRRLAAEIAPTIPRYDHSAIANGNSTEMAIYGGVHKPVGGSATVLDEFRRLSKTLGQWEWSEVIALGTGPGPRYGHAAAFHPTSRRMFLFGGSSSVGTDPSDAQVRVFTFDDASFASGSWSSLSVAAGPAPSPRRDHTMVLDPDGPSLFVFSGYLGATVWSDSLWRLDLSQTPAVWAVVEAAGDPPAPRAGHASYYDDQNGDSRLFIFGGEPTSPAPLDEFAHTIDPFAAGPAWTRGAPAAARLSGHTMGVDAASPFAVPYARSPEIFAPGTGNSPGSWSLQENTGWLSTKPLLYPVQFLVPGTTLPGGGGRLVQVGPDPIARYLDVPATGLCGAWQEVANGNSGFYPQTGVMYEPGRILVAGGTLDNSATGTAKTLDASSTAGWQAQPDMLPRYDHTLLMLPTGQVLATGGAGVDGLTPQHRPQIWTPGSGGATGTWTGPEELEADDVARTYHSTALLLPDGRVLTGGGRDAAPVNPDRTKLRLYCPPYLFNAQGDPAVRPVIDSAPAEITWGQTFTVCTANPSAITRVALMRPGAVTHSFDQSGRYVPVQATAATSGPPRLFVTAPASPDHAPPGDYLLFLLGSSDGPDVPSIARWVRLQAPAGSDLCDVTPGNTIADLTPDITTSTSVYVTWTATADDADLTASGRARQFLMRRAASWIDTEPEWDIAQVVGALPTPGPFGTLHGFTVEFLQPCTTYHFTLRAEDDRPQRSGFHEDVIVGTLCEGGGGGGFSAREVAGGEEGSDRSIAGAGPEPYLRRAPESSDVRPATGVGPMSSSNLQSEPRTLVVETARLADEGWRVRLRLATAADGLDPAAPALTIEREDADGKRDTLGRFTPGESETRLGLCALRERGRVAIPGFHRLEQVAVRLRSRGREFVLADARHSRLGSLGIEFLAGGGSPELLAGDVIELGFAPSREALQDLSACYLTVSRQAGAPALPFSQRPGLSEAPPERFALHPNEPNPAGSATVIRFDLPEESPVRLEIFDLLGRRVATLADGTHPAGSHSTVWGLRDAHGAPVRPGVYVCRLTAGSHRAQRKLGVLP